MSNATLFNCCTNCEAPDWSQFDGLELGGCINDADEDDDETCIVGGIDRTNAEFFTVYGHLKEGGCEAITDCLGTFDEALATAEELEKMTGLRLIIVC